jgi:hypothetical protein
VALALIGGVAEKDKVVSDYYHVNTDASAAPHSYHIWLQENLAITGGDPKYGEYLRRLKYQDVCFAYVNKLGIVAAGEVLKPWSGRPHSPPVLWTKPEEVGTEYAIPVNWFADLRRHPISLAEYRSILGRPTIPRGTIQRLPLGQALTLLHVCRERA